MNKYEIKPNEYAPNLWAVYHNGIIIYCHVYKCMCERKVKEFIKEDKNE